MMGLKQVAVVLAAGKGTRMKSDLPKVLHPVLGKPMIQRVLEGLAAVGLEQVIIVVGYQADSVKTFVSSLDLPFETAFVVQEPQLGTGHALMQVLPLLPQTQAAQVLITCGDMPLVPDERYQTLWQNHSSETVASLVTVPMKNPTGYGRVIVEGKQFKYIVEEKDASPAEKACPQVNSGIYCVNWAQFSPYLNQLDQNNAQQEFYLTDVLGLLVQDKKPVEVVEWPCEDEILGINSRQQLSQACSILSQWTANRLMTEGVSLINPNSMTLAPEIKVGPDSVLHPGCYLEGQITIGHHCEIGPFTTMRQKVTVGNHCRIITSYLDRNVVIGDNSYIGPFAHLRDNAFVGETVRIGNFVEVKETRMGSRSNAAHLCYLGDAEIGDDVNMGAGSIIANYDPILDQKHHTVIEDGVKVGCNSVLVSPVTLQERSCIAAGSVITKNVEAWDLAIARPVTQYKKLWVKQKLSIEL